MHWKGVRRHRSRKRRKKHRGKPKHARTSLNRARQLQHNDLLLGTKYRTIMRRQRMQQIQLQEAAVASTRRVADQEAEKRCVVLRQEIDQSIQFMLQYLDKVETLLQHTLGTHKLTWDYDIVKGAERFREELLDRFQTYVSQFDLSGFDLPEDLLLKRCCVFDHGGVREREAASHLNATRMKDLQRELKTLTEELEEGEIREIACIKVRQAEIAKLENDIAALQVQVANIHPS